MTAPGSIKDLIFNKENAKPLVAGDVPAACGGAIPVVEGDLARDVSEVASAPQPAASEEAAGDKVRRLGWVSPNYSISRHLPYHPRLAEEHRCVALHGELPEVEPYRVLRTQILQRTAAGGGNTVMITSANPGEGKTLTAINLALTFAKEFRQTALLVDCDLRKQNIRDFLGLNSDLGLVDYLVHDLPIPRLMVWPGIEKLTVISGGRTIGTSSELLGSPRMRALVAEMKNRYPERYVFFDVPNVLGGADALAFAPLVDHIIVTVRAGRTTDRELQKALGLLPREKVLGLVLNGEA